MGAGSHPRYLIPSTKEKIQAGARAAPCFARASRTFPLLPISLAACLAAVLAGCGTVYVNKSDRNPKYLEETVFDSNRNSEMTYRRIYTMLYRCTSGYYRIQGNYDSESRHGDISVDTGVGFERDLYFADAHVMSIGIDADGDEKSRVRVKQTSRQGSPYAGAMAAWVNEGSEACTAPE